MRASTTRHSAGLRCSFVISNRLIGYTAVFFKTWETAFRIIGMIQAVLDDHNNAHALSVSRDMLTETPPSFYCTSSVLTSAAAVATNCAVWELHVSLPNSQSLCAFDHVIYVRRIYESNCM